MSLLEEAAKWKSHHYGFTPVARFLPEGKVGDCEIRHFEISAADSAMTMVRASMHPDEFVPPGHYAQLRIAGQIMMSDTLNEQRSNQGAVGNAHGHMLIAGLGIGMILAPILRRREIQSVTVLESSPDVIALVGPAVRKLPGATARKLSIIPADAFTWMPPRGLFYDAIYFDIWPTVTEENLDEIAKLKRRFAKRLNRQNPGAWMRAWEEEKLRYRQAQSRRLEASWQ